MTYTPDQYQEELYRTFKAVPVASFSSTASNFQSLWSGANPTTGRALDSAWDGAAFPMSASEVRRIGLLRATGAPGNLYLYDRLVDIGGIQPNSTSLQSVSLPGLPRYADGAGVEAFLENLVTFSGSGPANLTINYVNQAGASKSIVQSLAGIGTPVKRLTPLNLAVGDYGFRTITSFQLDVAYTSAGTIGIVLGKRLHWLPQSSNSLLSGAPIPAQADAFRGGLTKFLANAAPWLMALASTTTVGGTMLGYSLLETQ